ncbi:acetyltransferase [Aquimarina sp. 2201CG14-23]|uniref:acetyltransferase n=1 Tax=Aquimarina mycalae TaxID=3040073 RepID=UPI002477E8E4|nr:acetyltransferase [Aquimarina sp. 2201CG14-23]MDH7446560.1 acetyltransferase [Aquimarina sp. 2201CG14-23]
MNKVLVIGASGHAKVIIEAIELNKNYEIHGLIDSFKPKGQKLSGYEVLGTEDEISEIANQGITKGIIAIGDNFTRHLMYRKIIELVPDFEFITVIHPSAVISPSVRIGKGTVILASATINIDTVVGDFCIINTYASFGHDGIMSDFSSLAPGVNIGGNVEIDFCTAICLGANVIQGVTIGRHCIIGAGSLILNNIVDFKLVYGVPGKEIRTIKEGESYLQKS